MGLEQVAVIGLQLVEVQAANKAGEAHPGAQSFQVLKVGWNKFRWYHNAFCCQFGVKGQVFQHNLAAEQQRKLVHLAARKGQSQVVVAQDKTFDIGNILGKGWQLRRATAED